MSAAPGHGERAAPSGSSLHSRHRMPTATGVRLERAAVRKSHEFMKLLGILSHESIAKARSGVFLKIENIILNFNSKYVMGWMGWQCWHTVSGFLSPLSQRPMYLNIGRKSRVLGGVF